MSACSASRDAERSLDSAYDPIEGVNRQVHAFNKGLDTAILRPVSVGYVEVIPEPVRDSVSNFSDNIDMPSIFVNSLLQLDFEDAGIAAGRFAINSTIGILGLLDAATAFAVPDVDTDFGETLAVWGVGEGAYVEVPVFGPRTARSAVGDIVDLFTNPLTTSITGPESYYSPATWALDQMNDRGRFASTVDSILYESADSYVQTRSIYLQNRRFELGRGGRDQDFDPYDDPYADSIADPYEDPYVE